MSQFVDTEHANESFRSSMTQYEIDRKRIKDIRDKIKMQQYCDDDVEWLCNIALSGIDQMESSWYDHG